MTCWRAFWHVEASTVAKMRQAIRALRGLLLPPGQLVLVDTDEALGERTALVTSPLSEWACRR